MFILKNILIIITHHIYNTIVILKKFIQTAINSLSQNQKLKHIELQSLFEDFLYMIIQSLDFHNNNPTPILDQNNSQKNYVLNDLDKNFDIILDKIQNIQNYLKFTKDCSS